MFTGTLRDNLDQWAKHDDEKVVFLFVDVELLSDWPIACNFSFNFENFEKLWDCVKKSHLHKLVKDDDAGLDMKIRPVAKSLFLK